jgi:hypothetical protein
MEFSYISGLWTSGTGGYGYEKGGMAKTSVEGQGPP